MKYRGSPRLNLRRLVTFTFHLGTHKNSLGSCFYSRCQLSLGALLVNMQFTFCPLFAWFMIPALALAFPSKSGVSKGIEPHSRGKRSFYERDGVKRTIFEHEATGAKIDFVTNSGICETTPGVNQYSGYLSVGSRSCVNV